ncbi:hypothetical protein K504DRAFT_84899 [Pleomassaria siparia CBS 279.74]|uniref:Uncharacterized protein n=1 Tax=Pleomassaria siparia CBS 279.74 TaxID=1314801 RepID=A0A6G1JZQ6_9PLEO|nr:hypothetical protein K504DRAFT_84899 [Pleomassaria siparia CBS 279.74]
MPPKARGSARGAPRGRGSSRGGTSLATAATPLEQSTESVTATEALPALDAVVPKAEDVYITATEGLNLGAAVDSQPTPSGATSLISSDSTARLPVPRLDDLKNTAPPSRSTSPAARRGTTRGAKKAAVKPTFTGRRSKEERDARDKLDRERQKERDAEAEAKQRWKEKAALRAAMRANPNANKRGGYTGPISGPFSLGSSTQGKTGTSNAFEYY